jgi:inosine/xanthosine triphosphate pyrophosphatase family protein
MSAQQWTETLYSGYGQSFAELGEAVKSKLSHRARAVQALINVHFMPGD